MLRTNVQLKCDECSFIRAIFLLENCFDGLTAQLYNTENVSLSTNCRCVNDCG